MNVVNVVASKGENNYSSASSTNRPHSQQQHEAMAMMKNEAMKQWRLANCFVCLLCVAALLIPFGFVSEIAPLLQQENDGNRINGSTTTAGRECPFRTDYICVSLIPVLTNWIIYYVFNRNKMNIRQNKIASYILAGLYFVSLFCMFICCSLFAIVFYYYYNNILYYLTLCCWIVIATYLTLTASIHFSAVAQGKIKSLLLMARILLLGLVAVLTNAVCTLGIPAWLSKNGKIPAAEPIKFINSETWLFEAAFAVGLLLALINVRLAPKQMEKYLSEKMGGESAKEKVQLYDILFLPRNS